MFGTAASDDYGDYDEAILDPGAYALLLKLLERNAERTNQRGKGSDNDTSLFEASYLLPLGCISMDDIGSLIKDAGCVVCGDMTINMCSSCISVYYCGIGECPKPH